jgi:hypothetical protein
MLRVGPPVLFVLALAAAGSACNGGPKDATEHTTDIQVADAGDPATYGYVARRPRAVVGLAEARGFDDPTSRAAVDRLANALSACAGDLAKQGKLVEGAARVLVPVDDGGIVGNPQVVFSPGPAVAANGLLCVVVPVRMLTFPPSPSDGGAGAKPTQRALALEVAWGEELGGAVGVP